MWGDGSKTRTAFGALDDEEENAEREINAAEVPSWRFGGLKGCRPDDAGGFVAPSLARYRIGEEAVEGGSVEA